MFLCFDIGGSSVKVVLLKKGKIVKKRYEKLPAKFSQMVELIVTLKREMLEPRTSVKGIGFSLAGALSPARDKMLLSFNIPYLNNKPLLKIFQKKLACKNIRIEHDINCFLLAEMKTGVAKKYRIYFI